MRKYCLSLTILASIQSVFAQQGVEEIVLKQMQIGRQQIDSLKKILAISKGTDKVDCLNAITFKYRNLPFGSWQKEADSSRPYAIQANKEAKRIGYKKGLGYSYLNLMMVDRLMFGVYAQEQNRFDSALFNSTFQNARNAISIGEELNDNKLLGEIYYKLSWLFQDVRSENSIVERTKYMRKAVEYFSKTEQKDRLANSYEDLYYLLVPGNDKEEAAINAISLYHELGQEENEIQIYDALCGTFWSTGYFEKGLEYGKRYLSLAKMRMKRELSMTTEVSKAYFWLSQFYQTAGDYETAIGMLRKSREYTVVDDSIRLRICDGEIGNVYRMMGKYDSAMFYLSRFSRNPEWPGLGIRNLSYLYLDLKEYDKALPLINAFIERGKKLNIKGRVGEGLTVLAAVYAGKNDYQKALIYAREGLPILKNTQGRVKLIDNYELLSKIFHNIGRDDSAYYYQTKFYQLKDSVVNRQVLWRLNNYKKEAEEERKTSQIKLQEQKLKQQAFVKNVLIAGIILLLLIGVLVFRTLLLKRKKERAELQRRATALEMQALRAQMNPHFIFNCLSSINKFILKNDTDAASDYLTRFSRLIRFGLTNSQLSLIPLSDEIEMLRLYLDMERLRFSDRFDYNIIYENTIEPETIYIPPMLLQPFCENAIWHGLMHKEGQGKLEVLMGIKDDQLQCIITDNGIGRKKAADLKTKSGAKQKSFGLKITTERLALFNNEKAIHRFYKTEDILDSDGDVNGTKVTLDIRFKNSVQHSIKETV